MLSVQSQLQGGMGTICIPSVRMAFHFKIVIWRIQSIFVPKQYMQEDHLAD